MAAFHTVRARGRKRLAFGCRVGWNKHRKRLFKFPGSLHLLASTLLDVREEVLLRREVADPPSVLQQRPHHLAIVALRVRVQVLALQLAHGYLSRPLPIATVDDLVFLQHVHQLLHRRRVAIPHRQVVLRTQLHQLRGRVGRGDAQSYCILVTDHVTDACRQRMQIMSRMRDGFQIAEADLKLRGPGDFFGERQHGLPPLKAADMMKDMELIRETEQAAEQLLQDDPTLQQPENQGLRLEVLRLFAKTGENGVIL